MASNLRISWPEIAASTKSVITSDDWDSDKRVENLFFGKRDTRGQLAAAGTSTSITFDLGSAATNTIDHVIFARADELQDAGVTRVRVQRATTSGGSYTTEIDQASFGSETLIGPDSQDWIDTISTTSAYRVWRVLYDTASSKIPHSKVYIGNLFDIGRDPSFYDFDVVSFESVFKSGQGSAHFIRVGEPRYIFTFGWDGITAANKTSFVNNFVNKRARYNFFLYTSSNHEPLAGKQLVHVKLVSEPQIIQQGPDAYGITASFEELIG